MLRSLTAARSEKLEGIKKKKKKDLKFLSSPSPVYINLSVCRPVDQ